MKHAEKLTKNAAGLHETKKELKGVLHKEDGRLIVTDSHRLYQIKDVYGGEEKLINPINSKVIEEKYPDTDRLLPQNDAQFESLLDVNEYLRAVDIISVVGKITNTSSVMRYREDTLSSHVPGAVSAKYKVPEKLPNETVFSSNAAYWLDALKMFKAFKYSEVKFNFYGPMRPFTLISPDDKLMALILPVRSY